MGGARNTGMAHATGEFIAFVDSDDLVSTNFLETLIAAQCQGDFDVVSGRHVLVSDDCRVLHREIITRRLPRWAPQITDYEMILGLFRHSGAWSRLYRRSTLTRSGVRFPGHIPHEDLFFVYKVLRGCTHAFADDAFVYYWRQRAHSLRMTTDAHVNVSARLRQDTNTFLNEVSASDREQVLAARRNLFFLKMLLRGSRERGGDVWKRYLDMIEQERSNILEDFARIDAAGQKELDVAEDVRVLLGAPPRLPLVPIEAHVSDRSPGDAWRLFSGLIRSKRRRVWSGAVALAALAAVPLLFAALEVGPRLPWSLLGLCALVVVAVVVGLGLALAERHTRESLGVKLHALREALQEAQRDQARKERKLERTIEHLETTGQLLNDRLTQQKLRIDATKQM